MLISILNSIEKIFFLARPIIKFSFQICCTRAKFAYIMCSNIIRQYYIKLMIFISFLVRIMRIESTSKHLQTARIFDSGRIVTYSTLILPTRRLIKSNIPALIRLKMNFSKIQSSIFIVRSTPFLNLRKFLCLSSKRNHTNKETRLILRISRDFNIKTSISK